MLVDINSERLSIYPGSFPKPRSIFKKPETSTGGFSIYIRPPIPIYKVKCHDDYIAEKSRKAETGIRKFYKGIGNSNYANKEQQTIFQPDATTDVLLSKYRETQIYSKPRMRKVNRKQLTKAVLLLKRCDDAEVLKEVKLPTSKISVQSSAGKSALQLKPSSSIKTRTRRKAPTEVNSNSVASFIKTRSETKNVSQSVSASTLKDKPHALTPHNSVPTPLEPSASISNSYITKPSKDEGRSRERTTKCCQDNKEIILQKRMKQGNYTTIITLKKNAHKVSVANDIKLKKVDKNNDASTASEGNSIAHMFKINRMKDELVEDQRCEQTADFDAYRRPVKKKSEDVIPNSWASFSTTESTLYETTVKQNQDLSAKRHLRAQPKKPSQNKEERYLSLPKITPSFSIELSKSRKKRFDENRPVRQGRSEGTFFRVHRLYNENV